MTVQDISNNLIVNGYEIVQGKLIAQGGARHPLNPISDSGDARKGVIVPLYEYPTWFSASGDYQSVQAGAPYASCIILNGNSGPPAPMNSDWSNQLLTMHAAGVMGIGYVPTNGGATPIATVEAMVDQWYNDYSTVQSGTHNNLVPLLDGIFFDQGAVTLALQSYYLQLYNYVKNKTNGSGLNLVVLNPGTIPDESYMQACDIICPVENTYTYYTTTFASAIPGWFAFYPASRFMHVVESVTTTGNLATAQAMAATTRGGYLYCIDSAGLYTTLAGNATSQPALWTNQWEWAQNT